MNHTQFSNYASGNIGSFHHGLALINAEVSDEALSLLDNVDDIEKYDHESEKYFRLLLELNSIAHERIHYMDTFGTVAGISFLGARTEFLKKFLEVGANLAASNISWKLPLSEWLKCSQVPPEVKGLSLLFDSYSRTLNLFLASFKPVMAQGHSKDIWVDLPFRPDGRSASKEFIIHAFPQLFEVKNSHDSKNSKPVTIFQPLGYEAILEGRAYATTRSWVERKFPNVSPDMMAAYGPPKKIPDTFSLGELPAIADNIFEIYNVTDLLVSKFLRSHGVHEFQRDIVLKLSDIALSEALIHIDQLDPHLVKVHIVPPGERFISLLKKLTFESFLDADYPEDITTTYQNFLASYLKGGDWQTVTGVQPYKSLLMWQSFAAQNIVIPLLRHRLATRHGIYSDLGQLMDYAMSLNIPRVEVINNNLKFHHMPSQVRTAWANQMFLGEIAEQIFYGARTIRCPRRHKILPGLHAIDFAGGECDVSMRRGCGSCTDGIPSLGVDCMFNQALFAYGLTKQKSQMHPTPTAIVPQN